MSQVLADKKLEQDIELYSFDIFDTLITRKTALPIGIFYLMQEELLKNDYFNDISDYIRRNFADIRINAEKFIKLIVRRNNGNEVTFSGIYNVIAYNNNLNESQTEKLQNLEIELELNNLVPIRDNIKKVINLINNGEKVVLISDMYHSSSTIRKFLVNINAIFENVPIYVSAEENATKHSKLLYEKLQNYLQIKDKTKWIHYGDNFDADVKQAKSFGINGKYFKFPQLFDYEINLISKYDNGLVENSIGASRYCRLIGNKKPEYNIGSSLTGPIFFPYVYWLIEQSQKRGINRLYFIARDGYMLKQIADIIIQALNFNIRTYYIYGSRSAWRVASIENKDDIIKIFKRVKIQNIADLSNITHISISQLKTFIKNEKNIDINTLCNNSQFLEILFKQAQEERELVVGYLKQEIDFNDDNFAFVEFQGTGTTQDCLNKIFKHFYSNNIKTFFLNFDNENQFNGESEKYIYYLNDFWGFNLFEVLLRANHGCTIGYYYELSTNKYYPKFEEVEDKLLKKWDFKSYIQGICDYSLYFTNFLSNRENFSNLLIPEFYMNIIRDASCRSIANLLGDIPFSSNPKENIEKKYAPILSLKDFIKMFIFNTPYQGTHFYMSLVRSPKYIRSCFKLKERYCNFRKFLFEININKKANIAYLTFLGIRFSFRKLMRRSNEA